MATQKLNHAGAIFLSLSIATLISWAGSDGGMRGPWLPLFAFCAVISFGINWPAFIPAYAFQTEHYYDLTGSLDRSCFRASVASSGRRPRRPIVSPSKTGTESVESADTKSI
jgi:hypothetical protein